MMSRVALAVAAAGGLAALPVPGQAQAPVAIVEDVSSKSAGVELLDYVPSGKVIRLGPSETLVLGYMKSCWRETISSGTVTVGAEHSDITDGKVDRAKVPCNGGKMQLTTEQAGKSGAMAFRAPPKRGHGPTPEPQLTIYGLSPVIDIKGGGRLVIERLDQVGERHEIDIAAGQLLRGSFYDLAKTNKSLAPGAVYRASVGGLQTVFKVDPFAQPGPAPVISRLLRFAPAG